MKTIYRHLLGLLWLLYLLVPAHANQASTVPVMELSTTLRQAHNLRGENSLSEWSLDAGVAWQPAQGWRAHGRVRSVRETALEASRYDATEVDQAFLEYTGEACSVRGGRQRVVWGNADRMQVLDLVHPLNLRESHFGDPLTSRRSLAMLNTECTAGDQTLQWLLIPAHRPHLHPQAGSRFSVPLAADQIAATGLPVLYAPSPDEAQTAHWSTALRWNTRVGPADLSLAALRAWQGDWRYRFVPSRTAPGYLATPERLSMFGLSVEAPLGPFVTRAEASTQPDVWGYYLTPAGALNATAIREDRSLLGLDYQTRQWFFATQYFTLQQHAGQALLGPTLQRLLSIAARRDLVQGKLKVTAFLTLDLGSDARYLSLEGQYLFTRPMQLRLAYDYFGGSTASFGQFHPESRLLLELKIRLL